MPDRGVHGIQAWVRHTSEPTTPLPASPTPSPTHTSFLTLFLAKKSSFAGGDGFAATTMMGHCHSIGHFGWLCWHPPSKSSVFGHQNRNLLMLLCHSNHLVLGPLTVLGCHHIITCYILAKQFTWRYSSMTLSNSSVWLNEAIQVRVSLNSMGGLTNQGLRNVNPRKGLTISFGRLEPALPCNE